MDLIYTTKFCRRRRYTGGQKECPGYHRKDPAALLSVPFFRLHETGQSKLQSKRLSARSRSPDVAVMVQDDRNLLSI